jgi:hypothetical protein
MSNAPINTIFLQGNLLKSKLSIQYPISKFQKGIWQLAIDSLSYELISENDFGFDEYLCGLKCNWITGINYNVNNELITESPFIFQFQIKGKTCIYNSKSWFEINSLTEFLICEVYNLSSNKLLKTNCNINILFQVHRIA